ncbi:class I SAM-dependent methyltransferase [Rhodopseudomonas palustris]|uniref:Class I SAM-dependent methyltransferase n=1 Tax=Rhodopseudomonas palustris TaxID=1076 RepID=A0A323U995_RHOPL|nr:class I SAM-dependent methyltransferase [Rhodopseudomonas palustris]PZA09412.1 class I SAM-dependent methyltransferase [Rhodopseudomonas palustris]
MDQTEFDLFADNYYEQHVRNISITGEGPEYFAEYKINALKQIADRAKLSPSRIFDFGAGIGNSIPFFRKYFPGAQIASADVSARSLEICRERFPDADNLLLIEEDRIPPLGELYDIVFSACVFHHIPHDEHRHWLMELRRITRPGGMIAIFEHNPLNPLTVRAVRTCPFDENARLLFARTLMKRLRSAGWNEGAVHYNVFFPRSLAALRPLEERLGWLPFGAQYVAVARKD